MAGGIYLENCQNFRLQNVRFVGLDVGVHMVNSSFCTGDQITMQDCTRGIILDNCHHNKFHRFNFNSNRMNLLSFLIKKHMYGH